MNIEQMPDKSQRWRTAQSIFLELDTVLSIISRPKMQDSLSEELSVLLKNVDKDWIESWIGLWTNNESSMFIIENAARLAGVLLSDQYSSPSLKIRELSYEGILRNNFPLELQDNLRSQGLQIESLKDQIVQVRADQYRKLGFKFSEHDHRYHRIRNEINQVFRILPGGDLHTRFWMLLDRFYYEYYQPWRMANATSFDLMEKFAVNSLRNSSEINLDWLPLQNPLLRLPELNQAVMKGVRDVVFWVEPFGMSDIWLLDENYILVSFSEFGELFKNFQKFAIDLSKRANALGDPTRLIILRLIRDFGMVNTEIATFLGISRPTVSIHAKILREAGLIKSRQDGRVVRHELDLTAIQTLFKELKEFLDFE
jgi:ArsR family transcriptional regulator